MFDAVDAVDAVDAFSLAHGAGDNRFGIKWAAFIRTFSTADEADGHQIETDKIDDNFQYLLPHFYCDSF